MYKIKRKIILEQKNKTKTEERLFGYDTTFVVEAQDKDEADVKFYYIKEEEKK